MAGQVNGDESIEELMDLVAKLQKDVNWLLDGNLSSKNVREIGGYQVSATLFQSRDGDVGLSSDNDADDPVRLWAGSADKDDAPWRVHKSGKSVMTGALIRSKDGTYPYVVMDPESDLFGAYGSATQSIVMGAYDGGATNAPYIVFRDGIEETRIDFNFGVFDITSSGDMRIGADNIELVCAIYPNSIVVDSWYDIVLNSTSPSTIQDELDAKATAGISTGSSGGHNHGIGSNEYIQIFNAAGVVTRLHQWSAAAQHSHSQIA